MTAGEVGAAQAIAEVHKDHFVIVERSKPKFLAATPWFAMCMGCGWDTEFLASEAEARDEATAHLAAVIVAAVPSWPAEAVAELIGGQVAYYTMYRPGVPYAEIHRQGDYDPKRIAAQHIKEGTHVERRVQGPWTEVQP